MYEFYTVMQMNWINTELTGAVELYYCEAAVELSILYKVL